MKIAIVLAVTAILIGTATLSLAAPSSAGGIYRCTSAEIDHTTGEERCTERVTFAESDDLPYTVCITGENYPASRHVDE